MKGRFRIINQLYKVPAPLRRFLPRLRKLPEDMQWRGRPISEWPQFAAAVRVRGCDLLHQLPNYTDPVLVAGCQRSGTTMLSRVITGSDGMVDFTFGRDDELDAALLLSGYVSHAPRGRYCFQTTFLNECYTEYFRHQGKYKLIWLLRNPYSVIYSFMYHWGRFAFDELFSACGAAQLEPQLKSFGPWRQKLLLPRILRACLAYNGKSSQIIELHERLSSQELLVVDYDELVRKKAEYLPHIFSFIGEPYDERYAATIHASSVAKSSRLKPAEKAMIDQYCLPLYERLLALPTFSSTDGIRSAELI